MAMPTGRFDDHSNSFGKARVAVKHSHGVMLIDFLKSLRPNYAVVYRDIAIGCIAIAATALLALAAEQWGRRFESSFQSPA